MTRINIVEPSELTDQHLIAEYRELFMVAGSLRRTLKSKVGYRESKVPKRYTALRNEMKKRGFTPNDSSIFEPNVFIDNGLYNDWLPTLEDYKIIRKRIAEKIAMKPNWYRTTRGE